MYKKKSHWIAKHKIYGIEGGVTSFYELGNTWDGYLGSNSHQFLLLFSAYLTYGPIESCLDFKKVIINKMFITFGHLTIK